MANYNISELKLKRIPSDFKKVKVACSKDSADFSRQFFQDDLTIYESMFLILLDNSNVTTSYAKISQGGVVGTVVDVVLIAKYFVDSLARGIILVHNHP